ncbi:MAG TPA: beta-galactosidase [Tepidisphaeraceae bacterium]|jgi:beta-galactosidase|nr:beta-galactosidase [Tepidisphaeraceae bacterium]
MFQNFHLGVCYYPEHWPASRHASDFRRMKEAGFDLVRMGEGAWSYFEPEEGRFQFDLFDRAIDLCRRNRIKVIFGTPTYCGPAWIAHNYPEVLRWNFERIPMAHGSRRNYNYTSPKFLELSDRICTALAGHYAGEKQIVGWQLDNEFNCHMDVSYSPSDTIAFRRWLREKYRTLDRLNRAWGTAFWSQRYSDWDQIDLPHPTSAQPNPTQILDESRFISDTVVRFARRQAGILRRHNRKWLITHNGLFGNVNGPDLVKQLDFFSHDQYPLFWDNWPARAEGLVQARSLSFPYGILEQQSGPGGQMSYLQRMPRRGEIKLWAWQSVAHGAKLVSFFRWRTCPYGSEQHWHGLLDQDNKNTRRLAEAKLFAREIRRLPDDFFDGAPLKIAAVLRDFDNEINERRINTYNKAGAGEYARWIAALLSNHIPADYVWPDSALDPYQFVILPHQKIVTRELADKLARFVKSGGTLVLGAQAGIKDDNCHIVERTPPGLLTKLAGVEVEDWTTLPPTETRTARFANGEEIVLGTFVERLRSTTATAMARWDVNDSILGESPAITHNRFGSGGVYYVGGYCPAAAMEVLLRRLHDGLKIPCPFTASSEVEIVVRKGRKHTYVVALNHSPRTQRVSELVNDRRVQADFVLRPFDVTVVRL